MSNETPLPLRSLFPSHLSIIRTINSVNFYSLDWWRPSREEMWIPRILWKRLIGSTVWAKYQEKKRKENSTLFKKKKKKMTNSCSNSREGIHCVHKYYDYWKLCISIASGESKDFIIIRTSFVNSGQKYLLRNRMKELKMTTF